MDFSSSSSSSSSQYKGRVLPAKPRWDVPVYESTPHYPPPAMDSRIPALNSQEIGRLASSPSYADYAYNYSGSDGGGASTAERGDDEGGGRRSEAAEEREHMFDKVVTPSDVGKLNRLVIPKQHAEKYFPLDSSSTEKGLLLNFEDRNGKSWRFRYSYWNSSQSYVMTKGWSRFVKEKKLDAGDVVSFQRGVGEIGRDRFYIDWRRRPDAPPPTHPTLQFHHHGYGFSLHRPIQSPLVVGPRPPAPPLGYHHHQARDHGQLVGIVAHPNHHRGSVVSYNGLASAPMSGYGGNYGALSSNFHHQGPMLYLKAAVPPQQMQMQAGSSRGGAAVDEAVVFDSVPVVHGMAAAAKRLRLFGVDMDCAAQEPPHRLVLNSPAGSSSDGAALQLRLHDGGVSGTSASAAGSFPVSEFPDKGKSSMSLDFDI